MRGDNWAMWGGEAHPSYRLRRLAEKRPDQYKEKPRGYRCGVLTFLMAWSHAYSDLAAYAKGQRQRRALWRSQPPRRSDHGVGVFRKFLVVGERDLAHLDDLVLVASDHHDLLEEGP